LNKIEIKIELSCQVSQTQSYSDHVRHKKFPAEMTVDYSTLNIVILNEVCTTCHQGFR